MNRTHPTVLLVHGAFADGSSWRGVAADLVYVAFVPELGESLSSITARWPTSAGAPLLEANYPGPNEGIAQVELPISADTFPMAFAADLPLEVARVAADADQMIHPDAQHDMAARAGAASTRVDASHAVALSRPGVVADAIRRAISVALPA